MVTNMKNKTVLLIFFRYTFPMFNNYCNDRMIIQQTQNFKTKLQLILYLLLSVMVVVTDAKDLNPKRVGEPLVEKLAQGMQIKDKNHARVKSMIRDFESHSQSLFTHLDGEGLVVFNYVVQEVERRGMPLEIAFIPLVESGYKPSARNGQHIGLWQLSPAAAKTFGLQVSSKSDGRLNLIKATKGALDYLEYLNRRFDGDWLLTIAAYNAGEGRVLRSIKKNRAAGKPTDYWHLDLPAVTKAYIPKVLALSELSLKNHRFNVATNQISQLVEIKAQNKAKLLKTVKKHGIDDQTMKYFNPTDTYAKDGSIIVIMMKEHLDLEGLSSYAL